MLDYLKFFLFAFFVQGNSNDLLDRENIETMPIPSTSQESRNATAILISTENIDDDDDDEEEEEEEEEESSNDILDQESIHLKTMPSTPQGDSTAAIMISHSGEF